MKAAASVHAWEQKKATELVWATAPGLAHELDRRSAGTSVQTTAVAMALGSAQVSVQWMGPKWALLWEDGWGEASVPGRESAWVAPSVRGLVHPSEVEKAPISAAA